MSNDECLVETARIAHENKLLDELEAHENKRLIAEKIGTEMTLKVSDTKSLCSNTVSQIQSGKGGRRMRKIQARRAIVQVLLDYPEGLTGQQIIVKLDPKISRNSITDTRHISQLLRGAKGVERIKNGGLAFMENPNSPALHRYKVLLYKVSDVNALMIWIGGKLR